MALGGFEHLAVALLRALKIDPEKIIADLKGSANNVERLAFNIDQRLTRIENKLDFIMEKEGWIYAERSDDTNANADTGTVQRPFRIVDGSGKTN